MNTIDRGLVTSVSGPDLCSRRDQQNLSRHTPKPVVQAISDEIKFKMRSNIAQVGIKRFECRRHMHSSRISGIILVLVPPNLMPAYQNVSRVLCFLLRAQTNSSRMKSHSLPCDREEKGREGMMNFLSICPSEQFTNPSRLSGTLADKQISRPLCQFSSPLHS